MSDTIKPWYDIIKSKNKSGDEKTISFLRNKNFKNHLIEPTSMILCIGGTGSGKSTSLLEFLSRSGSTFYKVIIFSGSTVEEPIYQYIKKIEPSTELYTDISELPSLQDEDDMKHQKILIVDDFINLKKSEMSKINEYMTAGRKYGYTVFLMAQNYISVPKTITRNINYFIIFKLNDNVSLNTILKNHNISAISTDKVMEYYRLSTAKKGNFLLIDLKTDDPKKIFRHNFLNFFKF